VSQIRGVSSKIKIRHSDPSADRSIKIVRKREEVFHPCRMMFKELKEKVAGSHHNVSAKKKRTLKNIKRYFWGAVNYCRIFAFRWWT
jgi:hypothetical protein